MMPTPWDDRARLVMKSAQRVSSQPTAIPVVDSLNALDWISLLQASECCGWESIPAGPGVAFHEDIDRLRGVRV
jgi:hypothetical protein